MITLNSEPKSLVTTYSVYIRPKGLNTWSIYQSCICSLESATIIAEFLLEKKSVDVEIFIESRRSVFKSSDKFVNNLD